MQEQRMQVACPKCQKVLELTLTQHNPINMETVSTIIIEHSGETMCDGCGTVIVPTVASVQGVMFVPFVVPPEQQKRRVVLANKGMIV